MSQNQLPNCQHIQNSGNSYPIGQQGNCGQSYFGQPMHQDPFAFNHQQQNSCPCVPASSNPCSCPPRGGQPQTIPCSGLLPQNIIEQIRTCVGNAAPIFVLPPGSNTAQQYNHQACQIPGQAAMINHGFSYPIGYPDPSSNVFPPPWHPCPFAFPTYDQFLNKHRQRFEGSSSGNNCNCCGGMNGGYNTSPMTKGGHGSTDDSDQNLHRCCPGSDDTICTKVNCPASINLQALASQFLSMQGVIPCAATRILLKRVPGSNLTTSVEETMERAQNTIGGMNRDQLIAESRNAQQVNGLINLHMVSKPPASVVPVLTMLQLKVNSLKALVENLVNKSITECHSVGAEANGTLEPLLLAAKSDGELRELLSTLRQRECEERVNLSYAPYRSQRIVAESRLANFQNKIVQVEAEMERRRAVGMPWVENCAGKLGSGGFNGESVNHGFAFHETRSFNSSFNGPQLNGADASTGFESPSPFAVQLRNPKRLNLKPNAGCPRTINEVGRNTASPEAFPSRKLKVEENYVENENALSADDAESRESNIRADAGGKKKLRIHVDAEGDLSVRKRSMENLDTGESLRLSPAEVVIVIDKGQGSGSDKSSPREKPSGMRLSTENKNGGKNRGDKSPGSNKSGSSTQSSEVSIYSNVEREKEKYETEAEAEAEEEAKNLRKKKKITKSKLPKNVAKSEEKKKTADKNVDVSDARVTGNRDNKERKEKKEKRVNVAMINEIRYDNFTPPEKFKSHKSSDSIIISDERLPITDPHNSSRSSLARRDDDDRAQDCDYDDDDDDDDEDYRHSTINDKEISRKGMRKNVGKKYRSIKYV